MQLVMECIAIVYTTHGYLVLCVAMFPFEDLNVCYIIIGGLRVCLMWAAPIMLPCNACITSLALSNNVIHMRCIDGVSVYVFVVMF